MAMDIDLIWGSGEADYFFNEDWTGQITLMPFRKLVFARRAFSTKILCRKVDRTTFLASSGKSGNTRDNISTLRPRERREPYLWLPRSAADY
jgi:hypothetical protein